MSAALKRVKAFSAAWLGCGGQNFIKCAGPSTLTFDDLRALISLAESAAELKRRIRRARQVVFLEAPDEMEELWAQELWQLLELRPLRGPRRGRGK